MENDKEHQKFLDRQASEKDRCAEIAATGRKYDMGSEALDAIQDGMKVEDFRAAVLARLESKIVNVGILEPQYRTGSGVPYGSAGRDVSGRRGPFRSFGEQLISIFNSGFPGGQVDPRLNILNATGLGTQFPSEGGFLVQTDFSTALLDRVQKTAVLFPKCWHIPIGPNADGVELPFIDETSRATGSRWGGVQVYRRNEADSVTAKKPKFGMIEVRLEDLMGLCYVTNRALKDAPSTGAIVSRAFEEEFAFRVDDEIIRGTGAGQATGILVSGSLVSVGKETGQLAKTIVYENLVKMYARMPIRNRVRAEWYYNQEIEPQLFTMGLTLGTGGAPVYMPGGGASASPYSTLFGRPMIPIEQASALGDVGDIIFADLNEYLIVEKGGMESEQSIHVRFIYDEMAFRFIMRNNGQPLWKTPLTPFKAAAGATLSPFVTLAQRA